MKDISKVLKVPRKAALLYAILITLFLSEKLPAQTRKFEENSIGWYNGFVNLRFHQKWSLHAEMQFRRLEFGKSQQQELYRTGLNYHLNDQLTARIGYAFIHTYAYGTYPLNSFSLDFNEHRLYEMFQIQQRYSKLQHTQRYMLEQRFVERFTADSSQITSTFPFTNRFRILQRLEFPLYKKEHYTLYAAGSDELFVSFGKNVNENVFDQNRLQLLLGAHFSKNLSIEMGYLQQILQLGREISGQNVFQNNRGIIVNCYYKVALR